MERSMKTKKPIALVYGHPNIGEYDLMSDVYYWEGLEDTVKVYSFSSITSFETDYTIHNPDVIVCIGINFQSSLESINKRIIHLDEAPSDNVLANIIVAQTVFKNSSNIRPKFS